MATKECVSCGAEANPKSEREFCDNCDAEFEKGLERQKYVEQRAAKIDAATEKGDSETVAKLMGEIAVESIAYKNQPVANLAPVSTATVRKESE